MDRFLSLHSTTRLAKAIANVGICSRRGAEELIRQGRVSVNGVKVTVMGVQVKDSDEIEVVTSPASSSLSPLSPVSTAVHYSASDKKTTFLFKQGVITSNARLWLYYKPRGVLVTHKDEHNRKNTVFALFKSREQELSKADGKPPWAPTSHVVSIGRLDLDSEGLLLLTDSKILAHHLEKPLLESSISSNISNISNISNSSDVNNDVTNMERVYEVRASGKIDPTFVEKVSAGVTVNGIRYKPAKVVVHPSSAAFPSREERGWKGSSLPGRLGLNSKSLPSNWFNVTLTEGKNREIRKIFDHFNMGVNRLIRVKYGPFSLALDGRSYYPDVSSSNSSSNSSSSSSNAVISSMAKNLNNSIPFRGKEGDVGVFRYNGYGASGKISIGQFVEQDKEVVWKLISDIMTRVKHDGGNHARHEWETLERLLSNVS